MVKSKFYFVHKILIAVLFVSLVSFTNIDTVSASDNSTDEVEAIVSELSDVEDELRIKELDKSVDELLSVKTNSEMSEIREALLEKENEEGLTEREKALLRGIQRVRSKEREEVQKVIMLLSFLVLLFSTAVVMNK